MSDVSEELRNFKSPPKPSETVFLERTLTFNNFISTSAILASSTEPISKPNTTDLELSIVNFNSIRNFIISSAKNNKTLFGKNIEEFINCTSTTKETNPNILMSNTRQFMNGIRNYLLKNDINCELKSIIEHERVNMQPQQILNVDSILEDCLQSIILRPLKAKIYYLLVDNLISDGSLVSITQNIKRLNELEDHECIDFLALAKGDLYRPNADTLSRMRNYYSRMQCEFAPFIKLKYVMFMFNELLCSISDFESALDDLTNLNVVAFLPVVIYSLCKCRMSAIQIEIDYIWSLVNRQLLTNECVYYLTLMSSACYVLKSLDSNSIKPRPTSIKPQTQNLTIHDYQKLDNNKILNEICKKKLKNSLNSYMNSGILEVYLADDKLQTMKLKTIPVKPHSKCREVSGIIASRFKIYNCDDYALYFLENGFEIRLRDDDKPLEVKIEKNKIGVNVKFVYKKKSANIVWAKSIEN